MNHRRVLQITIPILLCLCVVLPAAGAITVSGISPSTGINNNYVFIDDLSGTGFPSSPSVVLNRTGESNITAVGATYVSSTKLTCFLNIAGAQAGQWNVVVINITSGEEGVLPNGFTVMNPAPTLTSITPDSGYNNGVVSITDLAGTNFLTTGTTVVNLTKTGEANITATSVVVVDATQITCDFDLTGAAVGDWNVVLESPDGQTAMIADGFNISYPPPEVYSITPDTGTNDGVVGITNLAGLNFRAGANVTFSKAGEANITPINGPIITSNKIMCFMDLTGAKVGSWDVTVTNDDAKEDTLADAFTIYYPQAPTVASITPAVGYNNGTIDITALTGSGFEPGATVILNKGVTDIVATGVTVQTSGLINCTFDLTGAETGLWNVVVENDDGQSGMLADGFTVMDVPPAVTGITPDTGINDGPVDITNLAGSGFRYGATVALVRTGYSDIPGTSVFVLSGNQITCTFDITGAEAGAWDVVVTNDDMQSGTLPAGFTVMNPAPTVAGIDPATGINTGNVTITDLSGTGFLAGATVALNRTGFADIPGTSVVVLSGNQITCVFDLTGADAGAWNVVVTNTDTQSGTLPAGFTITNPPPTVNGITPDSGTNDGTIGIVNLSGTGFLGGASVALQKSGETDIDATGVTVDSATKIMCFFDLTGAPVGQWDVVVTNYDSGSGTLPAGFTIYYPAAPAVTSVTPDTGVNDDDAFFISDLAGTGFQDGATVVLQKAGEPDITATGVSVLFPNQISCTVNLDGVAAGLWDVKVTNDDTQSDTLADGFEVIYPAPTVTSITPDTGLNNEVVSITNLAGTEFRDGATVTFNKTGEADIDATAVVVVDPNTITCTVDLNGVAVGAWNVVVTNDDDQYGTLPDGFTVEYPAPTVTSITPATGANDGPVNITDLAGTYFRDGATVALTRSGYADIVATDVDVASSTMITCTFDLNGAALGYWDVTVTNDDAKSDTLYNGFQILPPPPVADFSVDPAIGTAPLTVQFTDLSTNDPTAWFWIFGDGSVSAGVNNQNPVHTYNEPGVYNVTLQVTGAGGIDILTVPGAVTVVTTPIASFTAAPTEGTAPLLVQFTDTSDGNPGKWLWQFGDGSYSFQQNPYHLYRNAGVYTVKLTVTNNAGSDTVTMTDLITVTTLPVADFSANRTSGTAPLAVQFTDKSTGSPTSWAWTFGDGGTSAEQNPVHVYTATGTYSVQLVATNSDGSSTETKASYINVGQGLAADFEYTTSNPDNDAPLTVAFTDKSTGSPLKWTWRFGDGYMSTERNPIHNYPNPGTYDITLTVTSMQGSVSTTKTIEVNAPLVADFTAEPTSGSAPLTVELIDTSVGTPNEWIWALWKDDLGAVVINPGSPNQVYTFNEPGSYSVQLIVSDAYGSQDFIVKEDFINVLEFP
jgi:PKD repeat protein